MGECVDTTVLPLGCELQGHLGILKAKLAKLRTQLLEPTGPTKQAGEGFDVVKYGDARIAIIGFPSVGKSTALALCEFPPLNLLALMGSSRLHRTRLVYAKKVSVNGAPA